MRSPRRTIAASVLVLEALVLFFAAIVAKDLSSLSPSTALTGGGVLALLCVVAAGLVRFRVGIGLGWLLQAVMIATGTVVPMMYFIGVVFAALWAFGLYVGAKVERERAVVAGGLDAQQSAGRNPCDNDGDNSGS